MPEYTGVTNIVIQFCVDLKANPPVLTNSMHSAFAFHLGFTNSSIDSVPI